MEAINDFNAAPQCTVDHNTHSKTRGLQYMLPGIPPRPDIHYQSWLRLNGQTVNGLNECINQLVLSWEASPSSLCRFWQKLGMHWNPHKCIFKSYHWHLWLGRSGWQCLCCTQSHTHAIATIGPNTYFFSSKSTCTYYYWLTHTLAQKHIHAHR